MDVLFFTTLLPRQQRMGSEVASQCFIEALRQNGHRVTVVGYMRQDDPFEPDQDEQVVGRRYIETKQAKAYPLLWMLLSFLLNLPYSSAKYYSRRYLDRAKALLAQNRDALVVVDHPQLGWLLPLLPSTQARVMIAHNIEQVIYQQNASSTTRTIAAWIYRREARLIQRLEEQLAADADQVWALTEQDAKYFASVAGAGEVRTVTLPAGLAAALSQPLPKRCDIGLIGSWAWRPNQEGLRWFLDQVYPLLSVDLTIWIAGRGADWLSDPVQSRLYPNLSYRGFVPNAQTFMAEARAVAIATLSGSGIQIKTLDAIASGSQIVATSIALRGIADLPPTVQVADEPQAFATAIQAAVQRAPVKATAANSGSNLAPAEPTHLAQRWQQARQARFLGEIQQAVKDLAASNRPSRRKSLQ